MGRHFGGGGVVTRVPRAVQVGGSRRRGVKRSHWRTLQSDLEQAKAGDCLLGCVLSRQGSLCSGCERWLQPRLIARSLPVSADT